MAIASKNILEVTVSSVASTGSDFSLREGSTHIYDGRLYPVSGSTAVIRPNEVFDGVMYQSFPTFNGSAHYDNTGGFVRAFAIYRGNTSVYSNTFFLGRSAVTAKPHHDPINRRLMEGQDFIHSIFVDNEETQYGSTDIFHDEKEGQNYVFVVPSAGSNVRVAVGANRVQYEVIPACHRFILYYVNDNGAWDCLVIEGAYKETDGYERTEVGIRPVLTDGDRSGTIIANKVTRGYALHTGWLTDEEAARMHHLLGSTMVYLWDAQRPSFKTPVRITNADCPYKQFKQDGMVQYEIDVELQQDIYR